MNPVLLSHLLLYYLTLSHHMCKQSLSFRFYNHSPVSLPSPVCHTHHTHLILLDLITLVTCEEYKTQGSGSCNILQPTVTSSHCPKYLLQHPVLKHHQPSFTQGTKFYIIMKQQAKFILIFKFSDRKQETQDSEPNGSKHSLNFSCSFIYACN